MPKFAANLSMMLTEAPFIERFGAAAQAGFAAVEFLFPYEQDIGDIATKLRRYLPHVGHIQIAGVPDRHELDTGELDYAYLFRLLDELGYAGWVGCEYRPAAGTVAGLGWMRNAVTRG